MEGAGFRPPRRSTCVGRAGTAEGAIQCPCPASETARRNICSSPFLFPWRKGISPPRSGKPVRSTPALATRPLLCPGQGEWPIFIAECGGRECLCPDRPVRSSARRTLLLGERSGPGLGWQAPPLLPTAQFKAARGSQGHTTRCGHASKPHSLTGFIVILRFFLCLSVARKRKSFFFPRH